MFHLLATGGQNHRDCVRDEFPHNRNKTFMTLWLRIKWEVHTRDTRGPCAPTDTVEERLPWPHIFGWCLKGRRKGLPESNQAVPIWGDLNGMLLPFSASVPLLVLQSYDAFNYHSCTHQTGASRTSGMQTLLVITQATRLRKRRHLLNFRF